VPAAGAVHLKRLYVEDMVADIFSYRGLEARLWGLEASQYEADGWLLALKTRQGLKYI
jgi:hypothetical protein